MNSLGPDIALPVILSVLSRIVLGYCERI